MKRRPIEARRARANCRGNRSERIAARCQEIEVPGIRNDAIVGCCISRVRHDDIVLGSPELHRHPEVFRPSGENVNPRAGAATTAALMRASATAMAAGATTGLSLLASNRHAKSPGYCRHIGAIFVKSGTPPMSASAVNPPADWPNMPTRFGSIAGRSSQVNSMWSITRLTCLGLSMMSTLRLWSA